MKGLAGALAGLGARETGVCGTVRFRCGLYSTRYIPHHTRITQHNIYLDDMHCGGVLRGAFRNGLTSAPLGSIRLQRARSAASVVLELTAVAVGSSARRARQRETVGCAECDSNAMAVAVTAMRWQRGLGGARADCSGTRLGC